MKKARFWNATMSLLLVFVLGLSLSACGAPSNGTGVGENGAGATGNTDAGRTDIVYCLGGDINSLDPTQSTNGTTTVVYRQLYDTLLAVAPDGTLEPRLAESWDIAEDGMSYTFHLRSDAYCHNGEPVTAEDVATSLNETILSVAVGPTMVNMKDAEVVDESTVKLNMTAPYSAALEVLAKRGFIYYASTENFDTNPIGTGPYQFVSRSSGENIVLKACDNYYRGEPAIEDLTFRIIADANTQLAALQKGEVDFIHSAALTGKDTVEADPNLVWQEFALRDTYYITMCELSAPFDNVLARKAVQSCVNKDAMLLGGSEGRGQVLNTLFPATLTGSPEESYTPPYEYDLEQAKEYLEQYKAETGATTVPVNILMSESTSNRNAATTLEGMLREVGFDVTTETVASQAFWASLMSSNYQIAIGDWGFPIADCDSVFPFIHSSTAGGNNFSPVIDDVVDENLELGRSSSDPDEREEAYRNVQAAVDENAYYIPLYSPNSANAYNKNLKGVQVNDMSEYFVYDWSW